MVKIFRVFNFCHVTSSTKIFYAELFPNYGDTYIAMYNTLNLLAYVHQRDTTVYIETSELCNL